MTLQWIEGWENAYKANVMQHKYAVYTGDGVISPGRTNFGRGGAPTQLVTPSYGSNNTWIVGFGFRGGAGGLARWLKIYTGASEQLHLKFTPSGGVWVLSWERGSTTLATSATNLASDVWYYIEVKVTIHPSTGAYELRINEETIADMTDTGVNTADSGGAGADIFQFYGASSWSLYLDDFYICDDQGATNNNFLGDSRVEGILPSADGDESDWSPSVGGDHYAVVDDVAGAFNENDYIESGTNGHKDLFEMEDLAEITGSIKGIMVSSIGKLDSAGSRTFRNLFKTDAAGTEHDLPSNGSPLDFTLSGTGNAGFSQVVEENPDTSAAWTISDIDAAQFGHEVIS